MRQKSYMRERRQSAPAPAQRTACDQRRVSSRLCYAPPARQDAAGVADRHGIQFVEPGGRLE